MGDDHSITHPQVGVWIQREATAYEYLEGFNFSFVQWNRNSAVADHIHHTRYYKDRQALQHVELAKEIAREQRL